MAVLFVRPVDKVPEGRIVFGRQGVQPVSAADSVHVDEAHRLFQRNNGMFEVIPRAVDGLLFAAEENEQDGTAGLDGAPGQRIGDAERHGHG